MNIQNRMDSSLMMDRAVQKRETEAAFPYEILPGIRPRVRITVNYMIN